MSTEFVDPRYADLDIWPTAQAVEAMWQGQVDAAAAIKAVVQDIALASDAAAARLGDAGRLVYVGAGTSGRVAVQDGAELLPTFGWPTARVVFALAGGPAALMAAVENAEDDAADGEAQMVMAGVGPSDVVIGVSASGATPFTLAAIRQSKSLGALTIGIACNRQSAILEASDHPLLLATGAEVLPGSTRMKAGTAQKIALNLISTAIMIRLGRVYRGQMVDMRPTNAKLRKRAVGIVADLANCSQHTAAEALAASGGHIKLAILVATGLPVEDAKQKLDLSGGNLRSALSEL